MLNIKRGTLGLVFMAVALMFVLVPMAQAADIVIGELEVSYTGDGPWFTLDKMAPGDTASKFFTVENNDQSDHDFKVMIDGSGYDDGLAEAMNVTFLHNDSVLMTSNFKRLWDESATIITLNPGVPVTLEMRINLDGTIGNDFQNRSLGPVNIYIGFDRQTSTYQVTTYSNPLLGSSRRIIAGLGRVGNEAVTTTPETVNNQPAVEETQPAEDNNEEILGASTEEPNGEPWWPWLIIPVASVLAILAISKHWLRDVGVPLLSGGVAGVAALMTDGPIPTWVFWTILVVEFAIGAGALYFVYEEEAIAAAEASMGKKKIAGHKIKK